MVVVRRSYLFERFLELAQCHRMDEDQALPIQVVEQALHWDRHSRSTILGRGDIRQFHVFPQCEQSLP